MRVHAVHCIQQIMHTQNSAAPSTQDLQNFNTDCTNEVNFNFKLDFSPDGAYLLG